MMAKVYLGLGTNIGNRKENLEKALGFLNSNNTKLLKVSSFLETAPYGFLEQDDFLNAACLIKTNLTPEKLLVFLNSIEEKMGRVRLEHWGPRIIDIDILLYNDFVVNDKKLIIPHADMLNRDFVLKPLIEIAGHDYVHPISKKTLLEHLEELEK